MHHLNLVETVVGRRSDANLVLNEQGVSRRHFSIVRDENGYSLADLGSSLGTYVNGQRVEECRLRHGDRIRIGPDGVELVYLLQSHARELSGSTGAFDLEKSIQGLVSLLPQRTSPSTDLEKLSRLLDLQFNWGQTFSAEAAFQTILKSALDISGAERGYILLKQAGGFHFQAGMDGSGSPVHQSEFRTSQAVVQHVAEHREPVLMTERIGAQFAKQESVVSMGLRALACLPLLGTLPGAPSAELLGILYLDSKKPMHALSVLDKKIMTKLAEQAGAILEKVEMIKAFEEQKKIEQDLIQAREIQRSLLPRDVPQLEGFRIHHFNHPTRHVGGDFYDFLILDSGELVGVLADVSGKGVPAALLASLVQGALHMEFRTSRRCDAVMHRLNTFLCEKALSGRFVTLFAVAVDREGVGHYVSAGHNTAYLYRAANGCIEDLPSGGLMIGAFPFATYECAPLRLAGGDILVVYSDGLTDAEGPGGEEFGEGRLREIILAEASSGSHALERKLLEEMERFTRGMPQTDDITFVLIEKYQPV